MVESVALASSINYSVYVNVTERVGVTPKAKLSAFDRLGIVVVVLLGTCIGLESLWLRTSDSHWRWHYCFLGF